MPMTQAAMRLPDDVVIAQVAQMKFVDRVGADDLGVSQSVKLGAADGQRVEARNGGSGYRRGIRVVEGVVVHKRISGKLAQLAVSVDA